MNPSSRIVFRAVVLGVLAMVLAVTGLGCGKKGPPLPPVQEMIAPPVNLKLSLNGTTATLTWSYGVKTGAPPIAGFEIDLATPKGGGRRLQGMSPAVCPPGYDRCRNL